ncbi:GlmU family protein [Fulvivirgaceae bacterium BMA10]|uniref:GlmU family protein n=2 Tax=Splendidivirga corallicola TaxID=3051826 RepID=A0ABT8KWQ0_9BACT|nr:GlmU family protein [Fulvivirgaceae bacterium BMA10]
MNVVLFDHPQTKVSLQPLSFTRPLAGIRVGILTIAEKWERRLKVVASFLTEEYLSSKYPAKIEKDNIFINGAVCPDEAMVKIIYALKEGQCLYSKDLLLAFRGSKEKFDKLKVKESEGAIEHNEDFTIIDAVWKIFKKNAEQIHADFELITKDTVSQPLKDKHTIIYGAENVFIEQGTKIRAAIINAENGPVYIGKDTQIHEGATIKGPFALCEGSFVNMGGKMRGGSTIGPFCKVGGEVNNSVIFGYSNKGHEGFLGNSVLGEWCNLGADTNNSNLKNNYSNVRLWHYGEQDFKDTGLQFCGLIMGDHSKSGINTMFNTGTVVGVSANVFGAGYNRKFVPSFSWGGGEQLTTYRKDKMYEVARSVMERRDIDFDKDESKILDYIFDKTARYRDWD